MFLCIIVFILKVIENAIGTLRIIVIANGKKIIGAILQGIIAIIWIGSTGLVVTNVNKNPCKIIAFALGSIIGSYLGSIIEEKIALGKKLLTIVVDHKNEAKISKIIRDHRFAVTSVTGKGRDHKKAILFILIPRKKTSLIIKLVQKIDKTAMIISESAFNVYGGYLS